ncbi:MAG TPA: hypothetical protein QF873_04110 [Patescibacteria group bacterium]|nr:hypothetical protein [Patescibacteria group bacterium]
MDASNEQSIEDQIDPKYGDLLLYWTMKEFHQHERGTAWYVVFLVSGIALILYAILTSNYIFAVLLILFGTFMIMQHFHDPEDVPVVILTTGLVIGNHYHPWDEVTNFWIAYEPPDVQKLYINFVRNVHPYVSIDLPENLDPLELRETMLEFVDENDSRKDESLTDYIKRLYKL